MIPVTCSTTSVFPAALTKAFRYAAETGFDGMEVMITGDESTRSAIELQQLSRDHGMPIRSIHAPVLLLTSFTWGRDPKVKLQKTAELATQVGAECVVVHPPFRWQSDYATRFVDIVAETEDDYGVDIAVENMFPWRVGRREVPAYLPSPDPADLDCKHVTLDFSHASISGVSALDLAKRYGARLRHVHLTDGRGSAEGGGIMLDEHRLPGTGNQPVAETLRHLVESGFRGDVCAEISTKSARSREQRLQMLRETVAFAREHLGQEGGPSTGGEDAQG